MPIETVASLKFRPVSKRDDPNSNQDMSHSEYNQILHNLEHEPIDKVFPSIKNYKNIPFSKVCTN